jgi:Holliday junction resolvase
VNNGINANITKTSIKVGGKTIYIGDGNIDIFGNKKQMNFIIQAKFKSDENIKVSPKDVREFAATLMEQPKGTIGFFVSNAKYSTRTQGFASNSKLEIILCNENNIVEKIKEAQMKLENSNEEFSIEEIITDVNTDIDIFGIKIIGSIRIGRITSRMIRNNTRPY